MPKVYILHDNPYSPKNFLQAEKYGELVFVFSQHISFNHFPRCVSQLREKFKGATKDDWIIMVGHPALIAVAGHFWFEITRRMNLLIWDNQQNQYFPIKVNIDGSNNKDT